MARTRLKTPPKTTSQSTGCTARARTSVGSRTIFFTSISAIASVCSRKLQMAGASGSAKAFSCAPDLADMAVSSLFLEFAPAVMRKNVVERGVRPDGALEFFGLANGGDFSQMHDAQPVAERVGLLHGVRGEQHGHGVFLA